MVSATVYTSAASTSGTPSPNEVRKRSSQSHKFMANDDARVLPEVRTYT